MSKKALYANDNGESLRKLFCDEDLAFKIDQPFANCSIQGALKEFP